MASDWYHLGGTKGAALLLPFIPAARILQSYLNNVSLLAALTLLKMAPLNPYSTLYLAEFFKGAAMRAKCVLLLIREGDMPGL